MTGGRLRIAMIGTPWFSLPPGGYGGIEAMCADLVDALVARGHDVVVFGAGADATQGEFVATYDEPQSQRVGQTPPEVVHAAAAANVLADVDVDVVHDHSTAGPLLARGRAVPTVVTTHGPMEGEYGRYLAELGDSVHLVAISDSQRQGDPELPWAGTVHNGLRTDQMPFRADKENFALFLGRCTPDKGIPQAIAAARAAGLTLRIACKCNEPEEQTYYEEEVEPLLGPGVEWLGEADNQAKLDLLASARCLLFPIQWEEPFGMVMIEAMACGTPVVALRRGAVPEVVLDGVTGIVCDNEDQLPGALEAVGELSSQACRDHVREHFDVSVMAEGYERIYRRAIESSAGGESNRMEQDPRGRDGEEKSREVVSGPSTGQHGWAAST